MLKVVGILFGVAILMLSVAVTRTEAACCSASCIGPVPWHACFADTTSCNTIPCVPPGATSLHVDASATCGQGDFASCPTSEVGQCNDNVNNDGWIDSVTDMADPDCNVGPRVGAPAAGPFGAAALVVSLMIFGIYRLARKSQS
ncbi:MAG TPA: hypothetical protein VF515_04870 [Candidatus Binatia bacterium]